MDTVAIDTAVAALRAGGTVLHPTEAVWGLACDPLDLDAVQALYALKQRPFDKGVILVADVFSRFSHLLAPVPDDRMRAVAASWPGPHTWVFPVSPDCPAWLAGDRGTLAVRVSAHPVVRALSAAFEGALVSTSANRSGMPPPRSLDQVEPALRAAVDAIVAGETAHLARPTVIRDVLTGEILRD